MIAASVLLATVAIVAQDQAVLRAAPRDAAAQHALLTQGDTLEIRGQRLDYLQVYDHRRERAGYVRASQLRLASLAPAEAPALLSVLRFVRDTPGAESLGIAYAAAYLKAAPAEAIDAEAFDALGTMAERLARRANGAQGRPAEAVAAQMEAASGYGVVFRSYAQDSGAVRLCYDGEAFRRVLAFASANAEQKARAALALTREDCIDPALRPHERVALDRWRADVLDRVDDKLFMQLPELQRNRLRLRRAAVWSQVAFAQARAGDAPRAAAQHALHALAGVVPAELADEDLPGYNDAAMRVGAVRWAAEPPLAQGAGLALYTEARQPGETCVLLKDARRPQLLLAERCTYGQVWTASVRVRPDGRAIALAVQPLAGWRELWVYRKQADGWRIDVLPPAASAPELGYAEFAGWVPGMDKMLVAREARADGRYQRQFEVVSLATLATEKRASTPGLLAMFNKWQDPVWKSSTVSLR